MKITDITSNMKAWIFIATLLVVVATTAGKFAKLPERVDKVESEMGSNKDSVQQLASTFKEYMSVKAEREKWEEQHEERQMILLDELRKSNGHE